MLGGFWSVLSPLALTLPMIVYLFCRGVIRNVRMQIVVVDIFANIIIKLNNVKF